MAVEGFNQVKNLSSRQARLTGLSNNCEDEPRTTEEDCGIIRCRVQIDHPALVPFKPLSLNLVP